MTRRSPHPLATVAGWIVVGFVLGYSMWAVGWCIEHATDAVLGVKR